MRFLPVYLVFCCAFPVVAQPPDLASLDIVERSMPAGPVALVEGEPVSRDRFHALYQEQLAMLSQARGGGAIDDGTRVKVGLAVLGELVQREILAQEAVRRGVRVTDAEVTQAYQQQLKNIQQEAQQAGGAVPNEQEVLQRIGKTREESTEEIRKALLTERVARDIAQGKAPKVTDAEVQQFYKDNPQSFERSSSLHLKQIYVRPKPSPEAASEEQWAAAQARIEEALKRIHAGENFEAVARAVSDAPDGDRGGDMGLLPVEAIPPFYAEVASGLKPGQLSKVFRTAVGLHLIQLVQSEPGQKLSFDEVKPRIRTYLEHMKTDTVIDAYCQDIMTDPSRVKVYLQLDKTLAALPGLKDLAVNP